MKNADQTTTDESCLGTGIHSKARQLVCFTYEDRTFGVDVAYVRRIISMPMNANKDGSDQRSVDSIAFEDRDIPLLDINSKPPHIPACIDSARVVIVDCEGILIGLVADVVSHIIHIPSASVSRQSDPNEEFCSNLESVYRQDEETIYIVDCLQLAQTWHEKTPNPKNLVKFGKASANYDR